MQHECTRQEAALRRGVRINAEEGFLAAINKKKEDWSSAKLMNVALSV